MNRTTPLILSLVVLTAACQFEVDTSGMAAAARPVVEYVNPRSPADGEVAPFSGAVWVGNTLYLSGMLGLERGQVPETAEQEATNVLDNVKSTLETAGLTMDDLVVVQVYASDVGDYAAFNGVYRTYFTTEFPARAFLGSGTLLFGARFEVMGIAARRAAADEGDEG
jgi:2-iminobutanoate/2-iminopropanoate deaminase